MTFTLHKIKHNYFIFGFLLESVTWDILLSGICLHNCSCKSQEAFLWHRDLKECTQAKLSGHLTALGAP